MDEIDFNKERGTKRPGQEDLSNSPRRKRTHLSGVLPHDANPHFASKHRFV